MTLKQGRASGRSNGPQIIPLDDVNLYHHNDDEYGVGVTMGRTGIHDDDEHDNDEVDSLLKATGGDHGITLNGKKETSFWQASGNFRQRFSTAVKHAFRDSDDDDNGVTTTTSNMTRIRGYIRSQIGISSTTRNFKILAVLAIASSMTIIYKMNTNIMKYNQGVQEGSDNASLSPHTPSFGGKWNSNHFVQKSDPQNNDNDDRWYTKLMSSARSSNIDASSSTDDTIIPSTQSNIGISTVKSISIQNLENKPGHYLHDPMNDPYASPYYAKWKDCSMNCTLLQKEKQIQYGLKMKRYSTKYGQWLSTAYPSPLVVPNFTSASNMDLPATQFPSSAWPANQAYVPSFLKEAKALISRVKEGIYEEYGYGILDLSSTMEQSKVIKQRLELFQVHIADRINVDENGAALDRQNNNRRQEEDDEEDQILPAIAYMNKGAWEALIRKLLHSMMTHDVFYTVLVGHTNTYLGNSFQQSSIMEFNTVMEPVFDKLGMTLISRNMGMNATTTNSALGGSDIYGEADILWHVPDPRPSSENYKNVIEESDPMVDFLFRQSILSGSRVPIILSPDHKMFLDEMNRKVWMGNIQPGANFCKDTYRQNGKVRVPLNKACRYVKCRGDPSMCDQHNSICWVERSDRTAYQAQDQNVGHQREGYPSVQQQRLEGRKLSMLILHALDEALDRWIQKTNENVLPLPDNMWHVSELYQEVREYVRTTGSGICRRFFQKIDPRICHIEMHAFTEWTPRADPLESRLKALIPDDSPVADKQTSSLEVYTEVALLPPEWEIPDGEVDVHMIAITADPSTLPRGDDNDKLQVNYAAPPRIYSDRDDDATIAELFSNANDDTDDVALNRDNDFGFQNGDEYNDDGSGRSLKSFGSAIQNYRNMLATSDISPTVWTVYNAPIGFCDGSAQSTCNRHGTNKCLLSNYNHYQAGLIGHGQSGKIKLTLPNVKLGIVLAKFDWREENGPRVRYFAPDFVFDYTVNGVHKTMDRVKFARAGIDLTQDLRIHILMLDKEFDDPDGQSVTIEMQVRSPKAGLSPLLLLTHLYYA